jgi:predicted RNA-binding protein with PIN domain
MEAIRRLRKRRYHPSVPGSANQPSSDVPLSLVRPALELAWGVARVGADARPPIPVPRRMRPFLRAAKLPDRVLVTIRQVLDEEAEFRGRVAELADEAQLGRSAWLWLVRPDGWSGELEELAAAAEAAASDAEQERQVKGLQRQLDSAQADLARLRGELAVLRRSGTVLEQQAEEERRARRKAESDRDRIQSTLQSTRAERARLEGELLELSAEVSARADEAAGAVEARAVLSKELDQVHAATLELEGRYADARQRADEAAASNDDLRRRVAGALSQAAAAAAELGGALGLAAESVASAPGGHDGSASTSAARSDLVTAVEAGPGPGPAAGPVAAGRARRRSRTPSPSRRTPLTLPPAVLDDSPDAAAHLVRAPGVVLIVDGYNITLTSWPELELAGQRRRLLDALAELTARTGATVRVVFDGNDQGGVIKPPPSASRRMQVQFTAGDVEADQVIIELVQHLGEDRPVVVASDDRWVRAEAAARGANLISVAQLLAVVGRAPSRRGG